jgi:MarR family transcriptional repressor of emrRAB
MSDYLDNLLGALSLTVTDRLWDEVQTVVDSQGQVPAALILLGLRPGMPIKKLAERLRLSHAGAVRLADGLVRADLVTRHAGEDRRTVRLHLTRLGTAKLKKLRNARGARLREITSGLTESQRDALRPILQALLEHLTRDGIDAYANCRLCDTPICEAEGCPVEVRARTLAEKQMSRSETRES